jgi:hypothetical protein
MQSNFSYTSYSPKEGLKTNNHYPHYRIRTKGRFTNKEKKSTTQTNKQTY